MVLEKTDKTAKMQLYNVLLTLESLYPSYFKKLMEQSENHGRTQRSSEIENILNLREEDLGWFSTWMKLNFGNFDPHHDQLRKAIMQTYAITKENETPENPSFETVITFQNHSPYKTDHPT